MTTNLHEKVRKELTLYRRVLLTKKICVLINESTQRRTMSADCRAAISKKGAEHNDAKSVGDTGVQAANELILRTR